MDANKLEERLITFAVETVKFLRQQPNTILSIPIKKQLVRACTSPALNYGEARGAESKRDFIHKLKLVLKELRETHITLRIIKGLNGENPDLNELLNEANQLIAIFVKATKTLDEKR
ncbi:MAG: four helix bundle protein [Saprospiraceae bacterium]|nr:four helix bundle protein [Saprospiraceae bacterium]